MYDMFGFPIQDKSAMFRAVGALMGNHEAGDTTPGMVMGSLWQISGNYSSTPALAVVLYDQLCDMCFPHESIDRIIMDMYNGDNIISCIKRFRDHQRDHGLEDGLKYCKNMVEDMLGR